MPHPLPGMNPWLESKQLWRGVHTSLITAIRDWLTPQVEPRYFVDIETHMYVTQAPEQTASTRDPDVSIVRFPHEFPTIS